jgi:hypothetical protein
MAAYKSWTGFGIREGANDCGLWMKFGSSSSEGSKYSDSDLAASVISLSLIWWSWDDDCAAAFRGNKS